jgi:hypothetical protein
LQLAGLQVEFQSMQLRDNLRNNKRGSDYIYTYNGPTNQPGSASRIGTYSKNLGAESNVIVNADWKAGLNNSYLQKKLKFKKFLDMQRWKCGFFSLPA